MWVVLIGIVLVVCNCVIVVVLVLVGGNVVCVGDFVIVG